MRLDIAAQTDIGRRKQKNEDYYGVFHDDTPGLNLFKEGVLLCVADGLGGHLGGEIASKLAVSLVKDVLKEAPVEDTNEIVDVTGCGPLPNLRNAIHRANASIYRTNQDMVKDGKPMGTTVLSALIQPKKAYIANVGDSRSYHLREGEFIDRTEDHSWVDEQVKQGLMSKAEAATDFRRNIVTRCVGTHPEIVVDTYQWNIVPGDMVLLCTDGLVNMVSDADILEEFRKNGTAAEIAQRLVALANENGGKDNITVVIASISPNPFTLVYLKTRAFFRRHRITPAVLLLFAVYGAVCATAGYFLSKYLGS